MASARDLTLEQLIEKSRSLIRQAEDLKRDQETLLRDLEQLRERTPKPRED
jgi:FtsZ-binding cell division protein ZapB